MGGKFNLLRKPAGTDGDIQMVRSFSFSSVGVGWGLGVPVRKAVGIGNDAGSFVSVDVTVVACVAG